MFYVLFRRLQLWACKNSFAYASFDTHNGGFIFPLSAWLTEKGNNVRLGGFITLSGPDSILSLLDVERRAQIDWVIVWW